jgi:hypothetical protein
LAAKGKRSVVDANFQPTVAAVARTRDNRHESRAVEVLHS